MNQQDRIWMARALELAERGRGYVEPNPLVGAVLVQDGQSVGEGWHQRFGHAHAEINAIAAAGDRARGSTLFVTLEPCCHHGKTPPCTDAVIAAGITRLVAAMRDPFPQVAGQGEAQLRSAGIAVEMGVCEAEARRLNAPYLKLLTTGRPYVHAKWAMTLDGKIATHTGDSHWISGEASRRRVHELRGRMDAIIVGIGTVLADDPLLTPRPPGLRTPCRVIVDSQGRLPVTSKLVATASAFATAVVAHAAAVLENEKQLRSAGFEILRFPGEQNRPSIMAMLDEMGRRRWTNVLVEGGATLLGAFLDARQIDEVHVFLAPSLLGGAGALSAIAGLGCEGIADAVRLADFQAEKVGDDFYLHGTVK